MKTNRSAQSTARSVFFFSTLSLITVGSMALGALLVGPTVIGPAAFGAGALLLLAVLGQELAPVRLHAYRVSRDVRPDAVEVSPARTEPVRVMRRRVPTRRTRLAKAGC
ncbi:MAG: hypothetical protein JJT96_04870 [Opitutales bacterium]|nr:hypothetical protein [Opitutales bacterium]